MPNGLSVWKNFSITTLPIYRCLSTNITISGETTSSQTKVALYQVNGTLIPATLENCKYVRKLAGGHYGCGSCKHGYSGVVREIYDLAGYNLNVAD